MADYKPNLVIPVWQKILIFTLEKEKNLTVRSRETKVTYSAIQKNVILLEKEKLVTKNSEGREVKIKPTSKGRKIAQALIGKI